MSEHTTSASAQALPEFCRVAALAAEVRRATDLFEFCDQNKAVRNADAKEDALNDTREAAENAASYFQTQSAVGAIFQLGLIGDHCSSIFASLAVEKQEGLFRELHDAVRRMCESVVNFISQDEAVRRAGCVDYYMSSAGHHELIESVADQARREERA